MFWEKIQKSQNTEMLANSNKIIITVNIKGSL